MIEVYTVVRTSRKCLVLAYFEDIGQYIACEIAIPATNQP